MHISTTWEDALIYFNTKFWQAAWKSKLQSIIDWDIFSKLILLPDGNNAITAIVFWDIKYNKNSDIARKKTWLVACSYIQIYEIEYEKTFTPSIFYDIFSIFFVIIAKNN